MNRVGRRDWIEWLDALKPSTAVDLPTARGADRRWRFKRADYDPFEDVVEIVLEDDVGSLRVLLDAPHAIEYAGPARSPDRIVITTDEGPFELSSVRHPRHARASVSRLRV
jgi:hypothetical protein